MRNRLNPSRSSGVKQFDAPPRLETSAHARALARFSRRSSLWRALLKKGVGQ